MVARLAILKRPIDTSPEKAELIVKACVALHNFLTTTEETYIPTNFVDFTSSTGEVQPGEWRQMVEGDENMVDGPRERVARGPRMAGRIREQFTRYFQSQAGRIPFQERALDIGRVHPRGAH